MSLTKEKIEKVLAANSEEETTKLIATLVSKYVRDSIEDIQIEYNIPQEAMAAINIQTRNAIFTAMRDMDNLDNSGSLRNLDYAITTIPSYWEKPEYLYTFEWDKSKLPAGLVRA